MRPRTASLLGLLAVLHLFLAATVSADAPTPTARPLELLLIDGLAPFFDPAKPVPRSWAMPFSHMDTTAAPFVDEAHLERSRLRFERYCEEVARLGYTAVFVGNLIHLALFDGLPEGRGAVYAETSPFRARHERYRRLYRRLADAAHARGLAFVVETDFPAFTPDLARYVLEGGKAPSDPGAPTRTHRGRAPGATEPRLLAAYQAAVREVMTEVGVDMLQLRVGEGGGAYDEPLTGYASSVGARTVEAAQQVIGALLAPIEELNAKDGGRRRLIARTWTIGIGPLGRLHTSPALYEEVFRPFAGRDALIASIKHVAMDFYEHVPFNPTIGAPGPAQIVEFQARREYELFGAVPSWRGRSFAADMARIRALPNVRGICVWPTNGGFLWRAPVFWGVSAHAEWTDANVFAYARMARDPSVTPGAAANAWARERGGAATETEAAIVAGILARSEALTAKALYVGAFAKDPPPLPTLDHAPTMLWLWWTRPIAAWGVQGLIWRKARHDPDAAIREGEEALAEARALLLLAETLPESPLRTRLVESLAFEESALEVMAAYRASFLLQLAWAESGDRARRRAWREADARLAEALARHEATYDAVPHLPPLDGRDLRRMLRESAALEGLGRSLASAAFLALIGAGALVVLSRRGGRSLAGALASATLAALLFSMCVSGFLGGAAFESDGPIIMAAALAAWVAAALGLAVGRPYGEAERASPVATLLAPAVPLLAPPLVLAGLLALASDLRGPALVWITVVDALYDPRARLLLGAPLALALLATIALAWRGTAATPSAGAPRRALGVALALVLGLLAVKAVLAPDLPGAVLALNRATRAGPSILGEAGTGVEDLVPGG